MVFNNLEEVYQEIDGIRQALFTRAHALDEQQAVFKTSPGRWSAAELIEHLALAEAGLVDRIDRMLTAAEREGRPGPPDFASKPITLEHISAQARSAKYQAPGPITPSGKLSIAESMEKLKDSRTRLRQLEPRLNKLDVSDVCFPHPVFGPQNLYQWLFFVGAHELRHLGQMEHIIGSPDFPKRKAANS